MHREALRVVDRGGEELSDSTRASATTAGSAGGLALAALCAQQFNMAYDTVGMNVALSEIVEDLDTTLTGMQAAIAMYAVVMAAFMITGAKLADRWGRRRTFIIGTLVYGIGSGITALSPSLAWLIFGWSLIEGLGSAFAQPALLTLATLNFTGAARTRAFAAIGATGGLASAVAPIVTGFFASYVTWRIPFALEVLLALAVIWLSRKHLAESRLEGPRQSFDFVGVALSALGFATTVFGFILASTFGFWTARQDMVIGGTTLFEEGGISPVPVIVGIGLLVLVLFAAWERWGRIRREREPLVRLSILRLRPIRVGTILTAAVFLALAGLLFCVPVFLQISLEYSAIQTGITMLPLSFTLLGAAVVGSRLTARGVAQDRLVRIGFLTLGVGCVVLAGSLLVTATKLSLAPGLIIVGLGLGLVLAIIQDFVQSAAPPEQTSDVAGFSRSVGYLGSALGTAVAGAVLIGVLIAVGTTQIQQSDILNTDQKDRSEAALESSTQTMSDTEVRAALQGESPRIEREVVGIYAEARNIGMQAAAAVLGVVSLLAFVLAFRLKTPTPEDNS
jgi:MFS family permease